MSRLFELRPAQDCRFDVVTLGEVMIRFDPVDDRIRTARTFRVSEGGGEYNVGRALQRVFGQRAALITAFGDNELGQLLEDLLLQGGMNLDHVVRKASDDVGRQHRTPIYFADRGFGVRGPQVVYDRAASAASVMGPEDVDWEYLFGELGVRWFHTGGIFAGLSDSTLATVRAALRAARTHGTVVSYDINYRPRLWQAAGGEAAAQQLTEELIGDVDVLFGVQSVGELVASDGPRPPVIAALSRRVRSAAVHDLSGSGWTGGTGVHESKRYGGVDVLDRIGSGDAFAAGVIFGLLDGRSLAEALEIGVAHAVLSMTTVGDTSSSSLDEINQLIAGNGSSIQR